MSALGPKHIVAGAKSILSPNVRRAPGRADAGSAAAKIERSVGHGLSVYGADISGPIQKIAQMADAMEIQISTGVTEGESVNYFGRKDLLLANRFELIAL